MKVSAIIATVSAAALVVLMPLTGAAASEGTDASPAATAFVFPAAVATATPTAKAVAASIPAPKAVVKKAVTKAAPKATPKSGHVAPKSSTAPVNRVQVVAQHLATRAKQVKSCPGMITGATGSAPSKTSIDGVPGTTSADLAAFALRMNTIRVANCLTPIPLANIRYDSCMEQRLFWMADDPSTNPASAWGHIGSRRSDGVPSVGCDGNLAGGSGNSGATVAQKWWDSVQHRSVEYRPTYTGSVAHVCILFAITHGGVPNESYSFTRAASRWVTC